MAEESQGSIQVDASIETRAGVFSDVVMALTKNGVTRLDFIQTDFPASDNGDTLAVLTSRVFMSNENLLQLRDMLNRHTSTWETREDLPNAE